MDDLVLRDEHVTVTCRRKVDGERSVSIVPRRGTRGVVHVSSAAFPLGSADKDEGEFRAAVRRAVPPAMVERVTAWLNDAGTA